MAILQASDFPNDNAPTRLLREGRIRRIAAGIYTDEVNTPLEAVVAREWKTIVGAIVPGAVVTDRSAFDLRPVDGALYVSHPRAREIRLPGLTVYPNGRNEPAEPTDTPMGANVFGASEQRALLDNMRASRARAGKSSRTLSRSELHDRIVRLASSRNTDQLARMQQAVDSLAERRGDQEDAEGIRAFFEAARGERPTVKSEFVAMRAAQSQIRYDQRRLAAFETVVGDLRNISPRLLYAPTRGSKQELLPFFEAYFSNFIEGTEFTIEEAATIALDNRMPEDRPADAHDIAGTFRIVNDVSEMSTVIDSADEFIEALKRRHRAVMEGRPDKRPGQFKVRANRAGLSEFVAPDEVEGTLRAGWGLLEGLDDPFARAVFTMFFVSEVHPFDDGNGRAARIMMNGELVRQGHSRIIVPTILRNDYLSALVRATEHDNIHGLVTVLGHAQKWAYAMPFQDMSTATAALVETNAMVPSIDAERQGLKLELPGVSTIPTEVAPRTVPSPRATR